MSQHMMVDLETMSTSPNAAIVSLAAVLFEPSEFFGEVPTILATDAGYVNPIPEAFRMNVSLESSMSKGLSVDASTILFWLKQPPEAIASVFSGSKSLEFVLGAFETWLCTQKWNSKEGRVWGHGATFDPVILANAQRRCCFPPLWHYANVRDTRTIFELANVDPKTPLDHLPYYSHDPMIDCLRQILLVQEAYRRLGRKADAATL